VIPETIVEPYRSALAVACHAWATDLGDRLVSLVLFGSVARGQATADSDVDLLVVAEGFPRRLADRRQPLLEAWARARTQAGLGVIEWSLVTKSPDEARFHSPLYLDIVEDGVLLVDRGGFFTAILDEMRGRMRVLGSRRVFLPDGSWYWDLKPDFRYGEVVEI